MHRPPDPTHSRQLRLPRVDPYIAALLGTVLLASVLPARGVAAVAAGHAATGAVALLFFLYGARMSTRDAWDGIRHWRLHLLVLLFTFALFPLLGVLFRPLAAWALGQQPATGLLFLCLLPSTVQSSIAFTSIARGNVAAAVCAGSFSNLLGVLVTPLLAAALVGTAVGGFSLDSLAAVGVQLLLPFVAGQALRHWIGGWVARHKRVLGLVDRGSILLVVYTAFSEGVTGGIWHQMSVGRLLALLLINMLLLAVVLATTTTVSRRLGFGREDRIAIVFAGSKKSLASGVPMATVLFPPADVGLVVLPLMLFHQLQLMVCAALARRWARDAPPADLGPLPPHHDPHPSAPVAGEA